MIIISTVNSYNICCTDHLIVKIVLILFDIFTTKNYRLDYFSPKQIKNRKKEKNNYTKLH